MSEPTTLARVQKVVAECLMKPRDEVKPEARFTEDLGADSLDAVDLIMGLEEEFGIEISDAEAEKLLTVQQVVEFIEEIKGES